MAKRPDLDALIVPKGADQGGGALEPSADLGASKSYAHTLSLRLTSDQYRRLRRFVADQEDKSGKRVTHQGIIEAALDTHLSKHGA